MNSPKYVPKRDVTKKSLTFVVCGRCDAEPALLLTFTPGEVQARFQPCRCATTSAQQAAQLGARVREAVQHGVWP